MQHRTTLRTQYLHVSTMVAMGVCLLLQVVAAPLGSVARAEEDVCAGLPGTLFGLCNSYCTALDCDGSPTASQVACFNDLKDFLTQSGGEYPPCYVTPPITQEATTSQRVYQHDANVSGEVQVKTDKHLIGLLRIFVFAEGTGVEVFRQEIPVEFRRGGSRRIPFALVPTPAPDESYSVVAALYTNDIEHPVEVTRRFGIRPPGFPAGVPDHILRADVPALNVADILGRLEFSADEGVAVTLPLGTHEIMVQVERQELLAPGVEIPGLGRPPSFFGRMVNGEGEMAGSLVAFTVVNGQLSGLTQLPRSGEGIPQGSTDTMWIQPLTDMEGTAAVATAQDRHLMYRQQETVPPPEVGPEGHGDPIAGLPEPGEEPAEEALAQSVTLQGFPAENVYNINIQVYEHAAFSGSTDARWRHINAWSAMLRSNLNGAVPRTATTTQVCINTVQVQSWRTIPSTGYGDKCVDNLFKFANDTNAGSNGVANSNTLQILFTTLGNDCGGIGFLGGASSGGGAGSFRRAYSLTRDVIGSDAYNQMVLAQETGHNLDWHTDWLCSGGCTFPHDSHLAAEISQSYTHTHWGWFLFFPIPIGDYQHCTAMKGSYGGCQEPEVTYAWDFSQPALRHLAEGVIRIFNPLPGSSCQVIFP